MGRTHSHWSVLRTFLTILALGPAIALAQDPPALNPFGPKSPIIGQRDDARPGTVELSDGTRITGAVYLTRDARLEIDDQAQKRKRSVPLEAVSRIDAVVVREWNEREWRFAENASDTKVYTGRTYPARELAYTLTLRDGRTIRGALAALVYIRPEGGVPKRVILHKRDKGPVGTDLKSLVYVRSIHFNETNGSDNPSVGLSPSRRESPSR